MDINSFIQKCKIVHKTKKNEKIEKQIFDDLDLPHVLYYIYKKFDNKYMFFDYNCINFFQLYYIYDKYNREIKYQGNIDIINVGFIYCKKYNINVSYIKKTKKFVLIYTDGENTNIRIKNEMFLTNFDSNNIKGVEFEYILELIDSFKNIDYLDSYTKSFDFLHELDKMTYMNKVKVKNYYISHPDYAFDCEKKEIENNLIDLEVKTILDNIINNIVI